MQSKMASPPVTPEHLLPSNADAEGGSSSRSNSPDGNCPICLGKVNNKAFTDACFHTFCFVCLLEWSKVRPTCPLCKTTFKSIIHNVVSNDVYDQYHLKPTDTGSFGTDGQGRRFRYSTTLTEEHRVQLTWRRNRALERRYRRAHQVHLEAAAVERRRMIYRAGLWVRHMGSNRFTRFRDISPEFFSENPATTHRLVPWLRRELGILFTGEDHVTFMTQYILSLIPNVHMQTEEFHEHLRPFLYGQTEHFIHEFVSFARSPYDMNTYDQIAQYDLAAVRELQPLPQQEPSQPIPPFQSSTDYNDVITLSSDDEVIEIPTLRSLLRSDSASSSSSQAHGEQVEALDLSGTHNPEPPPSHQFDPDQAGPSGISSNQLTQVKTECRTDQENVISDDDSDVEIVGVVKPYEERTPECIMLLSSSTEEDQDRTDSRREKKGGKRHKKRKHTTEDSHHKEKQQNLTQHSSKTGEHSHAGKSYRHSHKKKHKDSRHHKHSKSAKREHEEAPHQPKEGAHTSQKHHKRPHSRSRSKSSSSSHHTWRSSNKDSSVTMDDYSRDGNKTASSSLTYSVQSHSRSSSRQRSDQTYLMDTHRDNKRQRTEEDGSGHDAQQSGQPGGNWEVKTKRATDSDSSEWAEYSTRQLSHEHHHYKTTLSRKHKSSDSRDGSEGYKIRRPSEDAHSSGLHLTMVISRRNTADDREKSSSSNDFVSVKSSRSRHKKHKKHKRHKFDSERKRHPSKGKPANFVPFTHYDISYRNDDEANDGDESSGSTEEEYFKKRSKVKFSLEYVQRSIKSHCFIFEES
ncbi:E3 ubiquitin-protein ligase Topors-like [Patiria miniata]|uniref:E3 ubiquitin-protein ligase Topors n=1 Tax=Patiria miniata TaxID=46514 RepID=A0A913Z9S1_PATMI|nr:E3 ubiquitin-protein ligase Topors-like [Patiria miniata]XP_038048528.1 E3 ubiquitin-protein ligase Topors-like [Patiria miniata]